MRIGIYSPYLDTAGGGEKYILTIAEILSKDHKVDVFLDEHLEKLGINPIKDKIKKLHNLDLSKISFVKAPIGRGSNFLDKFFFLRKYDYFFYNTDGSIFYSTARNNIIHFQAPFKNVAAKGLWGSVKLSSWKSAIYNSEFTKKIIEQTWNIKGEVVYPPVSVDEFRPLKKKKQIISVGRLVGDGSKKHGTLIEAFKKLAEKGWSLHLAGGAMPGDSDYINGLKKRANGFEVYFYENASLSDLAKLYGESSIYWHAAGYGENDPTKMEHFGITAVEAMSAGCVPVVTKKGGLLEIVEEDISGYFWQDPEELVSRTKELISDKVLLEKLSQNARIKADKFSKKEFVKNILAIVS